MEIIEVARPDVVPETGLLCRQPSLTQQHSKDECDINKIVSRFEKSGLLSHVRGGEPVYGDFTNVGDFQSAVNQVRAAESAFMALPASVREEFDNDPGKLMAFLGDVKNRDKAMELGLIDKKGDEPGIPASPNPKAPEAPAEAPGGSQASA